MTVHPRVGERTLLVALLVGVCVLARDLLAGIWVCVLALLVYWWMQI